MIQDHLTELQSISKSLIPLTSVESMPEIQNSLIQLSTLKARVNDLIPEIQWLYDEALAEASEQHRDLSATVYKDVIKGALKDYARVMKYADRISSTIERASENYRSVLSSLKAELRN